MTARSSCPIRERCAAAITLRDTAKLYPTGADLDSKIRSSIREDRLLLKSHKFCEPTYPKEIVESFGIKVHDWVFPDGESPPSIIIDSWMSLVDKLKLTVSASANSNASANANANASASVTASASASASSASANGATGAIAVHCVAGLGRAPVLVAIALIENGMKPLDAVSFIRQRRRGAINNKQLKFLESYRPRNSKNDKCLIM